MKRLVVLLVLVWSVCDSGCTRHLVMSPARDAYYQVVTQTIPASNGASGGMSVSLSSTAATTSTTGQR